jgi:dipeptidyl aminopeptidase/acylaminoacyl peptidase
VSSADWSPNGNFLLYSVKHGQLNDLWILPLEKGAQPFPFANSPFDESDGKFSPDGHWIAYQSNETGEYQIYVRGFSGTSGAAGSGKWMISSAGGRLPQWRSDGKEIVWIQGGGVELSAISADVDTSNGFHAGLPRHLDAIPAGATAGAFAPDFKKDLLVIPESKAETENGSQFFNVMVNWTSALKKQ